MDWFFETAEGFLFRDRGMSLWMAYYSPQTEWWTVYPAGIEVTGRPIYDQTGDFS